MAPSSFSEVANTVEQFATKGLNERGWRLTTVEYDIPADRLTVHPFASPDAVGVRLSYKKGEFRVSTDVDSNPKATWRNYLPTISWAKNVQDMRHAFVLRMSTTSPAFRYALFHPDFTFTSGTQLLDGFSTHITASTRLSQRNQVGVSAVYDPSRSGLKDYTIAASRVGCASVLGGDIVAKYNATHGGAIHTRIPVNPYASAVLLVEKKRVIVGAEARSPCGAQMLLNVNLVDSRAMLGMSRNISDIWKITMTCSAPAPGSGSTTAPKFGLVFSSQNA
ncbi:hypothetical protein DQ04_06251010 [Trypanosoma grayi]|uniref:hypothetical protein n=1 Tax=Trypanosoma grayi TaxID=71804 RepID=UPI0004F40A05|nr:hypothetical protein DQ04_06251010 [Trypanosoma grayi]KEG08884.1 hypothetical protein DQ04_06251010 [Trypanosoma grayi]